MNKLIGTAGVAALALAFMQTPPHLLMPLR